MQQLSGGRSGAIFQCGNAVFRPLNSWSDTIHQLLSHYHQHGIDQCPRFITIEGEQEVLSFVPGDTYNYPLVGAIASPQAIISAAKLLRKLHDASESFINQYPIEEMKWMIAPRAPYEVICHGDFTPYNVGLEGCQVISVFDFDTAHPAPRLWELAYSLYCWAPFKTDENDRLGSLEEQIARAKLFCDSYGLSLEHRAKLVETMIERLNALVEFMHVEAAKGNQQFQTNLADGHHLAYLNDIDYLKHNKSMISRGLT